MSLVKDIKTILEKNKITAPIYLGKVLEEESISIFQTSGYAKATAGNEIEEPTFQVWVRAKKYESAINMANDIKEILHGQTEVTIENNRYLAIYHQSGPLDLGESDTGWRDITVNFRCYLEAYYVTHRVANAEEKKTQDIINKARILVNTLSDIDLKAELNARLDVVQEQIDLTEIIAIATSMVEMAEKSILQDDVDNAWVVVNTLAFGSDARAGLTARLNAVQAEINVRIEIEKATEAVIRAEETEQQTDVDYAKVLINKIPESKKEKAELAIRIENIQLLIDNEEAFDKADIAITQAESTIMQSDMDYALSLVNALPDVPLKLVFLNRLGIVQYKIDLVFVIYDAENYVDIAEVSLLQSDVNTAWTYVNKLPQSPVKTDFVNRLNNAQFAINTTIVINEAITKTELAENTKLQADVNVARLRVANIIEGNSYKASLTARLDVVQRYINDNNAMIAVQNAEATHKQADVNSAWVLVEVLPDSALKTDLINRLNAVRSNLDILNATYAVEHAEEVKTQIAVDNARVLVNQLSDEAVKVSLNTRLNAVQAIINASSKLSILIDFGTVDTLMSSPDFNGRYWNNITTYTAGYVSGNMKHIAGNDTNVTVSITKSFNRSQSNGVNTTEGAYPQNAVIDNFQTTAVEGSTSSIKVNNLNPQKRYKLTFFGSYSGSTYSTSTIYQVGEQSVTLNTRGNFQNTVFLEVQPDTNGAVEIIVAHERSNYGFISVLEITEL